MLAYQSISGKISSDTLKDLFDPKNYIDAAKKKMSILDFLGIDIKDPELKKQIEAALKAAVPETKPDLWKALGVSDEGEAKIKTFQKQTELVSGTLSQAFGEIASLYDVQIQKHEQNIQTLQNEIDEQQKAVDTQKDLAEQGYANDLDLEQKKLQDLQDQKTKEQQLLEDANRKKQGLQKAQLIADSISQLSNMVTAASEIFSSLAAIPYVGIPLAIATIGAMFAGFAAAKISAWEAINQTPASSYGEGGYIDDGNYHSGGGNKYRSMDGNKMIEIEKEEFVVNRKATRKHRALLENINKNTLDQLSDLELMRMLKPMGIHLTPDHQPGAIVAIGGNNNTTVVIPDDAAQWEKQNKILKSIKDEPEETITFVDGYRIEKSKNRIRKIRIK